MMEDLYPKMLCRINPWPEPVSRAFRHVNDKIYNFMQGKSEFLVTGNLKNLGTLGPAARNQGQSAHDRRPVR